MSAQRKEKLLKTKDNGGMNMKNKRKSIIGLGLIMALSVYAGAATTSTIRNSTGNLETMTENNQKEFDKDKCPMPPGKPGHEGKRKDGKTDKDFKRVDPARIEELKKKLNKGKVTKAEAAEIIELIDMKGRGPHRGKPGDIPPLNNNQPSNNGKLSN